jgi:hypothetical protein
MVAKSAKKLLINRFNLPKEIIDIVKDYIFHKIKKIPENDERYKNLVTIPFKKYDPSHDTIYVYLRISDEKDYFLVYTNFQIQLQILRYGDNNVVYFVDGSIFAIE